MHTPINGAGASAPVIQIDGRPKPDAKAIVAILNVPTELSKDGPSPRPVTRTAKPRATTNATTAPQKPRVTPGKGKSGRKASQGKKAPKGAKATKAAKAGKKGAGLREGSKTEKVLDLLKRPNGATLAELMKATGWQKHSVRGFLSGTVGKKLGLALTSTKGENGERCYSIKG